MNKFISDTPVTIKFSVVIIAIGSIICTSVAFGGWKKTLETDIKALQDKGVVYTEDISKIETKIDSLLIHFGINPEKALQNPYLEL